MNFDGMITVITVVSGLTGIALGWIGRARTIRQDAATQAGTDAMQRADVDYLKRGVDDIRLEQRAQGQKFDALSERVTRVEESAKQAHHRLNRLDGRKEDE
ncbi:hypothetical protein BPA01_49020 [Brevibacillus parabrevis]|uniref:Uncharacterized protein n=2 Tax=Brevibacillus parabrevis TaxID=54914 RepID=A0A4Y3PLC2_BREPA|nr:hypothetical protein EDM60_18865 [Brevibacillus parabrevis]GEB35322.1 hypothetical protein BPA01_49020 [Brevibacillus parabrevis]